MKNKLVFAGVLLVLFIMGAAAGSIVYSAIYPGFWVNYILLKEWMPVCLLVIIIVGRHPRDRLFYLSFYQAVPLCSSCRSSRKRISFR